jgi:DNA-binding XRE family transcriptional regulator
MPFRSQVMDKDRIGVAGQPPAHAPVGHRAGVAGRPPRDSRCAAERIDHLINGVEFRGLTHARHNLHSGWMCQVGMRDLEMWMEISQADATLGGMARQYERQESLNATGYRLRLTREAMNLSQAAFCRLSGISQTAWNNYERGQRRISVDEAFKLASFTGVSFDWIYRGMRTTLPMQLAERIRELENNKKQA